MAGFPATARDAFVTHRTKILADGTIARATVLCDGEVAGNIVCFGEPGAREVGYWLDRRFWGRGVACQALTAFLDLMRERPLRRSPVRTSSRAALP